MSKVIRGHNIYKTVWTAVIGQELITKPDERKEALDYDKLSFGVFKPEEEEHEMNISDDLGLVEQVEISSLLYYFLM